MKNIRGKQVKKILFILGLSAFLFSSCGSKPKTDDGVSQKIESDISEAVEEKVCNILPTESIGVNELFNKRTI